MKPSEIRDLTANDVKERIAEQEDELVNLRIQLATRQLDNPIAFRDACKDLARLKTVLREHELGIRELPNA